MIAHPKMTVLWSFPHTRVTLNLDAFIYSEDILIFFSIHWSSVGSKPTLFGPHKLSSYVQKHYLKYLCSCCTEESESFRFETTWGCVNDVRFFHFGGGLRNMDIKLWHICSSSWCEYSISSELGNIHIYVDSHLDRNALHVD